jgi:hypothetical protein
VPDRTGRERTGNSPCDLQRLGCSGPLLSRLAVLHNLPSRDRGGEENPGAAGLRAGGTICLRLRTSHSVNLGGVWAVFRRLPERGEELRDPFITLQDEHYLLSRAGPTRASEVYFEAESSSRWWMRSVFGSPRNLARPPRR